MENEDEISEHEFLKKTENNSFHDGNSGEEISITIKDVWYQVVVSNLGYLFTSHVGMSLAFSNLLLNEFGDEITSWFASIIGLSTPLGSCLGGPIMDKIGRKRANLLAAFICILSWGLMYQAGTNNVTFLYLARGLAGIAAGLTISNMVYVSEISHKKYRSMFLSLLGFYVSLGILITTIMPALLTWKQTALFYFIIFIAGFILIALFTPESPYWLASFRSDWTGAEQSLRNLIANDKVFEIEWAQLKKDVQCSQKNVSDNKKKGRSRAVYKALGVLCVLFVLQQLTCVYMVIMYALKIFPLISPDVSELLIHKAFILFGIIRFLSSVVGSILSCKFGRKILLMSSSGGVAIASAVLVVCAAAGQDASAKTATSADLIIQWISLSMFLLVVCFGTYGVMGIPWTLIVELLPDKMRSGGSALLTCYAYLLMFFLAKIFPFTIAWMGPSLIFASVAFVSTLFCIFVYAFVPETLGKSFYEIEQYFVGKPSLGTRLTSANGP